MCSLRHCAWKGCSWGVRRARHPRWTRSWRSRSTARRSSYAARTNSTRRHSWRRRCRKRPPGPTPSRQAPPMPAYTSERGWGGERPSVLREAGSTACFWKEGSGDVVLYGQWHPPAPPWRGMSEELPPLTAPRSCLARCTRTCLRRRAPRRCHCSGRPRRRRAAAPRSGRCWRSCWRPPTRQVCLSQGWLGPGGASPTPML
jgi:hypothetical protein